MTTADLLKQIFDKQIAELHHTASQGPLDMDDVKKLETLTRAWKTYNNTEYRDREDELGATLSDEELMALATQDVNE